MQKMIRKAFRSAGLDLTRHKYSDSARLLQGLTNFRIDWVLDIGANSGQFATMLRSEGYLGHIVSFEPLSSAFIELSQKAANDPKWMIHPRCAIGEAMMDSTINIAANSYSSSLLPMTQAHENAAPGSQMMSSESVAVVTLDSVFPNYVKSASQNAFVKIDTQGFEMQVLHGAHNTLGRLSGLQIEVSMTELYAGQSLWRDVLDFVQSKGFTIWSIDSAFHEPSTGQLLQADVTLFNPDMLNPESGPLKGRKKC